MDVRTAGLPRFGRMVRGAAFGSIVATLAACAGMPPSLAPTVKQSAIDYSKAMDRFADRALVANVLRARDYLPLNFSDLSSITGSFTVQGSLGASLPLAAPHAANAFGIASAGVASSASPVLTLSTLNTQGFIMGIIQPVSPMYVVSKWNDGYDQQTLMFLFIKSMKFADGTEYLNDPDDPAQMAGFNRLVAELTAAHVNLKPLTLLNPVGPPLPLALAPGAKGSAIDMSLLNLVKSTDGGELRVGNAACPGSAASSCVRLYKEYPPQVALCVDAAFDPETHEYRLNDHVIFGSEAEGPRHRAKQAPANSNLAAGRALMHARIKASIADNGGAGPSLSSVSADGAMPQVTASLQPSRVSVILDSDDCRPDEVVLGSQTEEELGAASGEFAQIEWRSISEAIQYLGAVVRNQGTGHVPEWPDGVAHVPQTLIQVLPGSAGPITVDYLGHEYSVPGEQHDPAGHPHDRPTDHGLRALAMLNELIGTAKVASNVALPQPVQFVIP